MNDNLDNILFAIKRLAEAASERTDTELGINKQKHLVIEAERFIRSYHTNLNLKELKK